jgi:hypothetical protein
MTSRLTDPDLLSTLLEPVHDAAAGVVLLGLLPAIHVAWADGEVQAGERARILDLAAQSGLADDPVAMARVHGWLSAPPTEDELHEAIRELRMVDAAGTEDDATGRALDWSRSVALAAGGIFGIGAIGREERRALDELDTALTGGAGAPKNGRPSRAAVVEVMRDVLVDRLGDDAVHVDRAPREVPSGWPQPSPHDPQRMPPAVFGVPEWEYAEYMDTIVGRYVRSVRDEWWDVLSLAASSSGVAPMDDAELSRLYSDTPFSRLLVPTLDAADEARFRGVIAGAQGPFYKVDLSHFASWSPLPGMHIAPTVGLFRAEGDVVLPLAIAVRDRVFAPGDGESWRRARYFLVQASSVGLVLAVHPLLHFPMDTVIAVTREVLPAEHPVAKLVEAHAYLHLPLNYGVMWSERSVAHNLQREVYAPFPAKAEHIFRGMADVYAGLPGNSAYPGFRYPMGPPAFFGEYSRFLARYYEVVLGFCRVVAHATSCDDDLERWGDALHGLLPGFPSVAELKNEDTLARALAGFVHTVSIWHSTDHHAYSEEPVTRVPQRLRVPEPTGSDSEIPPSAWLRRGDVLRQELTRRMFYEAHTVRSILETRYGFEEPELEHAAREFFEALRACDRKQPRRYIALERIACSLQF